MNVTVVEGSGDYSKPINYLAELIVKEGCEVSENK